MTKLIPSQRLFALLLSTSFLTLASCGGAVDAGGEEQVSGEAPVAQAGQPLATHPSGARLAALPQDPRNEQLQREIDEIREQRRQERRERQEQARLARESEAVRERAMLPPTLDQVAISPVEAPEQTAQEANAQP